MYEYCVCQCLDINCPLALQLALELPMIFFDVLGCSKSADG